jgi:hypothetical protein
MLNLFQRTQCEAIIAGETEPHQGIEDEVETIIADRPPAQIRTGASTHTAPTLDEWQGNEL